MYFLCFSAGLALSQLNARSQRRVATQSLMLTPGNWQEQEDELEGPPHSVDTQV